MDFKSKIIIQIFLITMLFAAYSNASEIVMRQDSIRQNAIHFFNSGDFEKAKPVFEKLVKENPDDDMLNYYYGACLAELDIFTDETNKYLLEAVSGNTPDKIFYYVGKYFHSKELWNSAIKYYNRFSNNASDEEKEEVEIEKLIEFCYSQSNNNTTTQDTAADSIPEVASVEVSENSTASHTETMESAEDITETFIPLHFRINSDIEYLKPEHFKESEALMYFNMGEETEVRISEILSESDSLRELYSKIPANREMYSSRILTLEQELYELKDEATVFFNKAREIEQDYWQNASESEIKSFKNNLNKKNDQEIDENIAENNSVEEAFIEIDPDILIQETPIEIDKPESKKDDEIIFKIQIGAYSRGLPDYVDRLFNKLSLIRKIDNYTDDKGITVYTTGNLTNFDDAVKMQSQIRQEGVKDAFVVAYKNGDRITLSEAKELLNIK